MSKGKPKPSLRNLSNVYNLSPHLQDLAHELETQSDRGAALIASAMVDVTLIRLIMCRMAPVEGMHEILFEKEGGPLGTFSARIKVARAFGIIGAAVEADLDCIRRIRNQFAHSPLKIDFGNSLIAAEIKKLRIDIGGRDGWSAERNRFIGTAFNLMSAMETVFDERSPTENVAIWTA